MLIRSKLLYFLVSNVKQDVSLFALNFPSLAWLHVFALSCDWFVGLSSSVVIGSLDCPHWL